ncbi:hypothetical protein BN1263390084 [Stenotrophomonas maltophilia]|nr:hypothetical protein BN1263390084 [Stenotrophomonas maltophilia]
MLELRIVDRISERQISEFDEPR